MSFKTKTIFSGLFGNALECYDFTLYANFSSIFAHLFFPQRDPFTALLMTFAIFATEFLVRPFGAFFFGYVGDRFGRRIALIISIMLMTLPTLLMETASYL